MTFLAIVAGLIVLLMIKGSIKRERLQKRRQAIIDEVNAKYPIPSGDWRTDPDITFKHAMLLREQYWRAKHNRHREMTLRTEEIK